MKRTVINISLVAVTAILFFTSCKKNKLPPLTETFSSADKIPFGTFVMRKELGQFYYLNFIRDSKQPFTKTWQEMEDTGSLYISVSKYLTLSKDDKDAMMNYVNAGNSMFISSEYIDEGLLKDLHCEIRSNVIPFDNFISSLDNTLEQMDTSLYNDSVKYCYYYLPFHNFFTRFDTANTTILGKNEDGIADFIIVYYGRGRFYLHCEPRAFSNYFLLQKDNYHYLEDAFSLTPENPTHVFWDDYYNKHNYKNSQDGESSLEMLLHYPPMKWAFWLSVLLLLLYILMEGKRRQRIIKVIPPNTNTTVAFTETIGRLYYQKKDNKDIADKMITYLLEHIRNQYFLNTSQLNDTFIETLSRKSSVQKNIVEELFKTIDEVKGADKVSDQQLLLFNQQIENFYKNKI